MAKGGAKKLSSGNSARAPSPRRKPSGPPRAPTRFDSMRCSQLPEIRRPFERRQPLMEIVCTTSLTTAKQAAASRPKVKLRATATPLLHQCPTHGKDNRAFARLPSATPRQLCGTPGGSGGVAIGKIDPAASVSS